MCPSGSSQRLTVVPSRRKASAAQANRAALNELHAMQALHAHRGSFQMTILQQCRRKPLSKR